MCTGNYVQINKIMNFGLKWQRLGTDYLSCFTTAGMICTASKLIKLDMLHSILEHVISSRHLNIFTLQMHGNAPVFKGWWSFSNWFHLDDKKKRKICNIKTTEVDMWWMLSTAHGPFLQELWIRAFCQTILFHVCFHQKPLRNPAALGRTERPGQKHFPNHDRGPSFQGEKGSTYI